jgi:hypothetical protein
MDSMYQFSSYVNRLNLTTQKNFDETQVAQELPTNPELMVHVLRSSSGRRADCEASHFPTPRMKSHRLSFPQPQHHLLHLFSTTPSSHLHHTFTILSLNLHHLFTTSSPRLRYTSFITSSPSPRHYLTTRVSFLYRQFLDFLKLIHDVRLISFPYSDVFLTFTSGKRKASFDEAPLPFGGRRVIAVSDPSFDRYIDQADSTT